MIVLWGAADDPPLIATADALRRQGAESFFLDQRRARETSITLDGDGGGEIRLGGERCDLAKVAAVYARGDDSRRLATGAQGDSALRRHAAALDETFAAFLDVTPALVVNPPAAMASNGSKPYQLGLIHALDFSTPDTLVTTDPAAVRAFLAQHGEIVYKSTSSVRSIVARLNPSELDRLADVVWCPTQFQEYVPGRDYRVHVIGDAVFCSEILSDADDYRYGEDAQIVASAVPIALEAKCRALASSLGLHIAGIDLRLAHGGDWVCFEVNPTPGFTYFETATQQPIASALATLLASRLSAG
jgi:glutathione synthase/RimK-type ligase-like ATP-grasp enzyme